MGCNDRWSRRVSSAPRSSVQSKAVPRHLPPLIELDNNEEEAKKL